MNHLWILINRLHDNWNIYIGKKSLKHLEFFLNGAKCYCEKKNNIKVEILPGFDNYMKKIFIEEDGSSFFNIIEKKSNDDGHAFDLFYELMFDYVEKMGDKYEPIKIIEK